MMKRAERTAGCLLLASAVALTDEAVKRSFQEPPVKNTGFAMNRMGEKPKLVAGVSALLTAGCMTALFLVPDRYQTGVALLLGGAFSNTRDRLVRKYVVDYIPAGKIYFNLSDLAIVFGAALTVIASFQEEE